MKRSSLMGRTWLSMEESVFKTPGDNRAGHNLFK